MTYRSELRIRYPAILEHASLSYEAGWAVLLDTLCERLQHHADHGGQAVQITQAKEKWGELSVNGMGGDDSTYGLIDIAEALSAHICELCGSPGRLHEGQIFRTRCSEHAPK